MRIQWVFLFSVLVLTSCGGNRSTGLKRRIVPDGVSLTPGSVQAFEIQPPAGVPTWSIDEGGPGQISAEGRYEAPFIFHEPRTITIRAYFEDLSSGMLTNEIRLIGGVPDSANCCGVSQRFPADGEYVYVDELPEAIVRVAPSYPDSAREAGVDGTVLVHALVCKNGMVFTTRVAASIPLLDAAAVRAVEQWRFIPARIAGQPVAVWVAIPIRFTLHDPSARNARDQ
jgi:TonB family protein